MRYYISLFVVSVLLLMGCSDYLDTVPKNDIETIETIFEKREDVDKWVETCYYILTSDYTSLFTNPAKAGADEIVSGDFIRQYVSNNGWAKTWDALLIADGLQMAQEPYCNVWKNDAYYAGIRYCNIFLENIHRTYNMEDSEKKLWSAEIKALKAQYYFELMRRYGPIILVPQNIDLSESTAMMQQPRSAVDTVVKHIVALCDEAMLYLPPMQHKDQARHAFHNLESAATLKAMALFYAASPLFNGNSAYTNFINKKGEHLFSQQEDREKWRIAAEAIEEAIELAQAGGKKLVSGNLSMLTSKLNTMMDIENSCMGTNFKNDEAILMFHTNNNGSGHWYRWTLPYVNSSDKNYYWSNSIGGIGASMKMVEMFYTEHGLPIEEDAQWEYSARYQLGSETNPEYKYIVPLNERTVLNLHLRREPRFYADIAADRTFWIRGTKITDDMVVKAYRDERYGTGASTINSSVSQNLSGYYIKKGIHTDVQNNNYNTVNTREEATIVYRLAELYLMAAEAWNEYEGPDGAHRTQIFDRLNAIRKRAGIPDVETSWRSYAKNPDKVNTQAGLREIIRREWNIEFAFEGQRFWNLRRWLTATDELNDVQYGWNILGKTTEVFYNNFEGPIVVWSKRKFVAPRDYLFPIRSEEILISGCRQNPGW